MSGKTMVAMPSQVLDVAWHEFILFTRPYKSFCKKALGHFLHHTPAEAMESQTVAQDGIKRAWRLACHRENISNLNPNALPLLFAIDSLLKIPDGFIYSLECNKTEVNTPNGGFCVGDIGCGGDLGSGPGSDFSDSGSSCGGGCGGGS